MQEHGDSEIMKRLDQQQRAVYDMLLTRGWQVEVIQGEQPNQVDTQEDGLGECGDGRFHASVDGADDQPGPKIFGGVYGVMAARNTGTVDGFRQACRDMNAAGVTPTVHDDDHGGPCGKEYLWRQKKLTDLPELEITSDEAREVVKEEGGAVVTLAGGHVEDDFSINFVKGTTRNPDDSKFHNDAWFIEELDLDVLETLTRAAETVEGLTQVRTAQIWI